MLIKTMKDASGLVNAVGEELEAMTKTALSMELSTILHALDAFQSAQSRMKTMNKRTEMEMTFIRLCTPEMDTSPAALLRRIEALERGGLRRPITPAPSVPVAEAPAAPVQQPETPQNNAPVQPAVKDKPQSTEELAKNAQPFDGWSDIIGYMENYSKSVASAFKGSAAYISGDYMLIEAPQIAFDLLKRASQREKIREAIQQVTGRVYKLGPYKPPAADGEKPKDPLDAFLHDMREAGVEIEEKLFKNHTVRSLNYESTFTAGYGRRRSRKFAAACTPGTEDAEQMEQITTELEAKEYTAAAGGGAVSATVTGKMEVKNIDIKPEVIDPDDAEMLGDLVAAAVNEALRAAANEKEEKLGAISGGMSLPGIL